MSLSKKLSIVTSLYFLAFHPSHAAIPADIPSDFQVTAVSLTSVNDVVFNASTQELLVSVGSLAGYGYGNSITRIGLNGTILGSQFVGSEPGKIALSSDGTVGYVALQAAPSIKQFNALTGTTISSISTPSSTYSGATRAEDIAVSPDNANVIAVSISNTCCSPRHEGVYIIENGQVLPNRTPGHTGSNTIEFGANGSILYGYNNETTEFGFRTMSVNNAGVSTTSVTGGALYGFYQTFTYEAGLAYSSSGVVFNPSTGEQLGKFSLPYDATFTASVTTKRAYAIDGARRLTVFDFDTFTPIATFNLAGQLNDTNISKLIYTQSGSLAAIGPTGVYVLSAVPEIGSMWMMILGLFGLMATVKISHHYRETR
ncbi:hypothetical protein GTZ97_12345 [Aquabacterium fontiphilum]|uniref:hypothetical protein n=1 Tax=Aquabacterium fontiphilum TaxID=450365 RepID=UPI0013773544|nr:hypothetical protein [Aquabacterium fontiphilum]NBD21454.1 hypothetical protein [Aquabacterium fontiphilum]